MPLVYGVGVAMAAVVVAVVVPLTAYADPTTPQGQFFPQHKSQFSPLYALLSAHDKGLVFLLVGCLGYAVLAVLYWQVMRWLMHHPYAASRLWHSWLHWVLLVVVWGGMLVAYPLLSDDAGDYVVQARLATHYGANPYLPESRNLLVDDHWQASLSSSANRAALSYGPVWLYLSLPVVAGAGDSLAAALLGIKLLSMLLLVGCGVAVWLLLAGQHANTRLVLGVIWHPLVLVEVLWSGHNDLAMLLWLLLMLVALERQRWLVAVCLLVCGIATKYLPLMLAPLVLAALLRWWSRAGMERGRIGARLAGLAVGGGVVLLLLYAPVAWGNGGAIFAGLATHAEKVNPSIGAFLRVYSGLLLGEHIAALVSPVLVITLVGWQSWRVWRGAALADALLIVLLTYMLILSPWLVPWYGLWGVVLAPLSRSRWLQQAVPGAVLVLPTYYLVNALPFPDWLRVLLTAGVALVWLAWGRRAISFTTAR